MKSTKRLHFSVCVCKYGHEIVFLKSLESCSRNLICQKSEVLNLPDGVIYVGYYFVVSMVGKNASEFVLII